MTAKNRRKDVLTKKQRSFCMSQIRGKDTKIEIAIRSALHRRGLRFKKNVNSLPGRPDIVFPKQKIIIFIDGNFWHGYHFKKLSKRLSPFWRKKIANNIKRDKQNRLKLKRGGWEIMRLWEEQSWKKIPKIVDKIERLVRNPTSKTTR